MSPRLRFNKAYDQAAQASKTAVQNVVVFGIAGIGDILQKIFPGADYSLTQSVEHNVASNKAIVHLLAIGSLI